MGDFDYSIENAVRKDQITVFVRQMRELGAVEVELKNVRVKFSDHAPAKHTVDDDGKISPEEEAKREKTKREALLYGSA